jgi:pimeloyl-ACP methyl ester carboxylesterase
VTRRLALAVLLTLVVAGCSGDDDPAAAPTSTTTTSTTAPTAPTPVVEAEEVAPDDDLYAVPDPLPDAPHGTLLRYQPITPSLTEGATSWRVMYLSESVEGEPIAVTGTVVVPDGPAPEGGRITLAIAHGTTGIADECAPSKDPGGRELALAGTAVDNGWIIAETDYEGLGTPGRHPYLVGESEGRGVVDAVLAAGSLPAAERGDQVLIAGYSQGGHGALWANEVAGDWAPELEVVGTFAGAPATEIDVILRAAPRLPQAGFAYMIVAGFEAAYAEADPALFLTEEGLSRLDAVDEGCTGAIFDAVSGVPASELVRADGADSDPWAELALTNNPGQVATEAPVLIIHSDGDDTVPVALSGILEGRMCENGQVVERRVITDGGGHVDAAPGAYRDGLAWLEGLLAGEAPTSSCPG